MQDGQYEKYLSRLNAESEAYLKNAKRKQVDQADYFSKDYEKYDHQFKRDQLKLQAKHSGMEVVNWYNDSEGSSDDLDEIIESIQDQKGYSEELDPSKMSMSQLDKKLKENNLQMHNLFKEKEDQDYKTNTSAQLKVKSERNIDQIQQFSKMKLSELVKIYQTKKEDLSMLDLEFYNLSVDMSLKGGRFVDLKSELQSDQNLMKLLDFVKVSRVEMDGFLIYSKKLRNQQDDIRQEIFKSKRKQSILTNAPESDTSNIKFKERVDLQIQQQHLLQNTIKDNQHQEKIENLKEDIQSLQDKITSIKLSQESNFNLKDRLKEFVLNNLIDMDMVLANMAHVKIKMIRQTQIFENQQLESVVQINETQNQEVKQKCQIIEQEMKKVKTSVLMVSSLKQQVLEMQGIKERLFKQLQIRRKEYEEQERHNLSEKRVVIISSSYQSSRDRFNSTKGGNHLSFQNMVNIRGQQQKPSTQNDDETTVLEQTMLAKKKSSELIIKIRVAKVDLQQDDEMIKIQKKLVQLYMDFQKLKAQQ